MVSGRGVNPHALGEYLVHYALHHVLLSAIYASREAGIAGFGAFVDAVNGVI